MELIADLFFLVSGIATIFWVAQPWKEYTIRDYSPDLADAAEKLLADIEKLNEEID